MAGRGSFEVFSVLFLFNKTFYSLDASLLGAGRSGPCSGPRSGSTVVDKEARERATDASVDRTERY